MKITNQYKRVPLSDIRVNRADRQRKVIDTSDLDPSIRTLGVLHPIIVDRDLNLIAGERRWTSSAKVGLPDIPVRFVDELSKLERKRIELEENVKRLNLPWREEVQAIGEIHGIYLELEPDWDQKKTAQDIGMDPGNISRLLRVYRDLGSPKIASAESLASAFNILARFDERKLANVVNDLIDIGDEIFDEPQPMPPVPLDSPSTGNPAGGKPLAFPSKPSFPAPIPPARPKFPDSIIQADFHEWISTYRGPTFNFIHCDFPYGVNVFGGDQSGRTRQDTYSDDKDVYWNLIETFCKNIDKFMSASAHLMFWLSNDISIMGKTIAEFRRLAPDLVFSSAPLYWTKTDNVGIIPDAKRGPRRIVETALFASREDRLIVRPTNNWYGAPTDKAHHTSTKPEPVLRYFFGMFVDENTTIFDPTCGSGSALRAAESLGARTVLGLERDKEHWQSATDALRNFRVLREANRKMGD